MNSIALKTGESLPTLGLGTWRMGESHATEDAEVAALRCAFEIGYRLIDTAEMYGEGGAERVLGRAIEEALSDGALTRDDLFVVSKVYPHNASRTLLPKACDRSRARLGLDCIDLYLLHWRGAHPLEQTVEAFEALRARGAIRHWGVSNFDVDDLKDLWHAEQTRGETSVCCSNQVYYSLGSRGSEFALQPLMRRVGIPLMAYTPIDQGRLGDAPLLRELAEDRHSSATQIALAWVLAQPGVIAIPKAVSEHHLQENWDTQQIALGASELARIDARFPPPKKKVPLATL